MNIRQERLRAAFHSIDWWFILPLLFLLLIGLTMQYSIGINQEVSSTSAFTKQLVFVLIGGAFFFFFASLDHRIIHVHPLFFIGACIFLLVLVLLFGTEIKGTTGWFIIAGFSFQPVELVKLLYIMGISLSFDRNPELMKQWKYALGSGAISAFLIGLIMLQPDLGSSSILFFVWLIYAALLRAPKTVLIAAIVSVVVAVTLGWFFLFQDYQRNRLLTFIDPSVDPLGAGYNITQSLIAIGSGGIWGKGLGQGSQSQLHFLPEVTSDFIFAAIAEEFGFVGIALLICSIGLILWRFSVYMRNTKDSYAFLLILGIAAYYTIQSVMNMAMNVSLLPVTGVPLPLVSAGGSSMIATLCLFGMAYHFRTTKTLTP